MLKIVPSNQFKKDLKLAIKRKANIKELENVVDTLAKGLMLDKKYRDHELKGSYKSFRECHINPDWLLMYKIEKDELELFLFRTGSHADLFN